MLLSSTRLDFVSDCVSIDCSRCFRLVGADVFRFGICSNLFEITRSRKATTTRAHKISLGPIFQVAQIYNHPAGTSSDWICSLSERIASAQSDRSRERERHLINWPTAGLQAGALRLLFLAERFAAPDESSGSLAMNAGRNMLSQPVGFLALSHSERSAFSESAPADSSRTSGRNETRD